MVSEEEERKKKKPHCPMWSFSLQNRAILNVNIATASEDIVIQNPLFIKIENVLSLNVNFKMAFSFHHSPTVRTGSLHLNITRREDQVKQTNGWDLVYVQSIHMKELIVGPMCFITSSSAFDEQRHEGQLCVNVCVCFRERCEQR